MSKRRVREGAILKKGVQPASPKACSDCPWRLSNQGRPHPGGWYTKANLRRLWSGLRHGVAMTCHPTDPDNPMPPGLNPPAPGSRTVECAGALVLQQREIMIFQDICNAEPKGNSLRTYKQQRPGGMSRMGLIEIVERFMFGGVELIGGAKMTKPDLNDREVGHAPLPWHFPEPPAEA